MSHRILILTPWVPYPVTGACQQDRFFGMLQMKSMGYDIRVIAKIHDFQNRSPIEQAYAKEGVPLTLVSHLKNPLGLLLKKLPQIFTNPGLLDGAALEYLDPVYLETVDRTIESFKPDVLWIEYSTHWSILKRLKQKYGIPMIVKSSLNEPRNCIDEHGGAWFSRLKALPKYTGERVAAREASMILGITPDEEAWYRALGATKTGVLPLRGLAHCFTEHPHQDKQRGLPGRELHVVFLSSNYNMGHNRDAFEFLAKKIIPLVREKLPGRFVFHLTGSKFPDRYRQFLADDLRYEGFIPDLAAFLQTMDIALCPWISGQGMQQKVFEPLCRGIPLLTTKTAGYPFENGKEVMLCKTPEEYVNGLRQLLNAEERSCIAGAAQAKAKTLFGEDVVKKVVSGAIEAVIS